MNSVLISIHQYKLVLEIKAYNGREHNFFL